MRMQPATPLADILEKDWDRHLFAAGRAPGLATTLGWHSHWTFNAKGSAHGFPDRTLARERVIFVELKREKTKPTPDQIGWLDKLAAAGGEVYLWRPGDLDEIAHVLSKRWRFGGSALSEGNGIVSLLATEWQPRSLWIPGRGRADTT